MATVFIPAQMADTTGGVREVSLAAANVREVVAQLEQRFPGIGARLQKGDALAPTLQVSIDGVLSTKGLRAAVGQESEVHFLPAMVGG